MKRAGTVSDELRIPQDHVMVSHGNRSFLLTLLDSQKDEYCEKYWNAREYARSTGCLIDGQDQVSQRYRLGHKYDLDLDRAQNCLLRFCIPPTSQAKQMIIVDSHPYFSQVVTKSKASKLICQCPLHFPHSPLSLFRDHTLQRHPTQTFPKPSQRS